MDWTTLTTIGAAVARRWWLVLLVLLSVMAVDVAYTATRQRTYLARTTLVISPSVTVDRGQLVYSVDSLGRGRVVGTFVEVLGSELVQREAVDRLGLPPEILNKSLVFKSAAIAESAVVQILVEGDDPETSARAANAAGEVGIEHMTALYPIYSLTFLSPAVPPTSVYRPDPLRNYSLGLIVGTALAVTLAYLVDLVVGSVFGRRGVDPPHSPATASASGAVEERPVKAYSFAAIPHEDHTLEARSPAAVSTD